MLNSTLKSTKDFMASKKQGSLEIICGPMFSGKTEELIRRIRRAQFARLTVQVFKHSLDKRSHVHNLNSHNGTTLIAHAATTASNLTDMIDPNSHVIGFDEVQFFDPEIVILIDKLVHAGKRVIAGGLDLDFRGLPFGCMPTLLALADEVSKLKAVCIKSGKDAHHTQRLVNGRPAKHNDPLILIGAAEAYEARSRDHFSIDKKPLQEYIQHTYHHEVEA